MSQPLRKSPATYADVLRAPEGAVAEVLDGELVLSPRPAMKHAHTASGITRDIGAPFHRGGGGAHGPGGWWIIAEPEIHLGADIVVPDIAGWRRDRLAQIPDAPFMTQPPDWACEVVSPSSVRRDRIVKRTIYAGAKVPWVWLVDPAARTVESFELDGERWTIAKMVGGNAPAAVPPFDAVSVDLSLWWGETPDPTETDQGDPAT